MAGLARLLLELTGTRPLSPAALQARVQALDAARWAGLLLAARRARVAAQVAAHLQAAGLDGLLPPGIAAALRTARLQTLVAGTQQTAALARLHVAFGTARIPFRLLKGLALAQLAYPVPAARAVGDIDLWVRPADRARARRLLAGLGLVPPAGRAGPPPAWLAAYGEEAEYAPAPAAGIPAAVDLHWRLVGPWWVRATLSIPEAALFARPHPVLIGGRPYATLDPTDSFYYLCLHAGFHHQFRGLRPLIDLAWLARGGRVDWARLRELARASGSTVPVWRGMALADAALGSSYARRLGAAPGAVHRHLVRAWLPARLEEGGLGGAADLRIPREHLVLLAGPGALAGALGRLLWPPATWVRLRYAPLPGDGVAAARRRHLARLRGLLGARW